ncbi:MAG: peroxide stress protein YaaA [Flavobacteriales bacterium]|nr:peroxide stress protein YaaA [Flavobacteriales bacterium]
MLALLSPAKDLDMTPVKSPVAATQPAFLDRSEQLMTKLRTLSAKQLATLMDINPKLAALNHSRNQAWARPFTAANAKPAVFAFNGEVYRGLDAATLDAGDLRFAQHHVRILSGLYGALRPLDLMQAYRLEMGTAFGVGRGVKDLYAYWGDTLRDAVQAAIKESGSDVVLNLASTEYVKAVRADKLKARVVTPVFKDRVGGGYKMLMVYAKHQRGAMCRWMVKHRVLEPERLKAYDGDGYRFAPDMSTADEWTFVRDTR